jgi:hypothetical protein
MPPYKHFADAGEKSGRALRRLGEVVDASSFRSVMGDIACHR